ncbi:MFS transporter [Tumebacillus sp. DT12]|uniref:MFS transporter n=1 Tax=Tumebacillus lacus TaxID=2995335 RepID=A0ABT3X424_9BACL|nr:MFS transporter [Tumebacillus lacus]MCX7571649.1 MFS transporter [Tumebacillus lacus]
MQRDLGFFYLYRITSRLYFHLPVLFVYFFMVGIPVWQIEILLAVYGVMISLTSQVSVTLMRFMKQKQVIAFGELLKGLGLLIIIWDTNFWFGLAGQIVTGVGYSLAAGTDSALLRQVCSKMEQGIYQKVESGSASYMFLAALGAGIVGSVLFGYEQHWAFYAGMAANVVAIGMILAIREEAAVQPAAASTGASALPKQSFTSTQKFWMSYYSLSRAFALAPFVGFLPFFFFTTLQVSLYWFGVVLSLFSVAAFISARYMVRWSERYGSRTMTMTAMGLLFVSMLLFGFFDQLWAGLIAITLMGLSSGGVRPLTISNLNRTEMTPSQRTALLSSMERQYGVWNASLLLAGGYVIYQFGFQPLTLAMAGLYVMLLLILFLTFGKSTGNTLEGNREASM